MSAKYWQRGETIDYTATDDLARGGGGIQRRHGAGETAGLKESRT